MTQRPFRAAGAALMHGVGTSQRDSLPCRGNAAAQSRDRPFLSYAQPCGGACSLSFATRTPTANVFCACAPTLESARPHSPLWRAAKGIGKLDCERANVSPFLTKRVRLGDPKFFQTFSSPRIDLARNLTPGEPVRPLDLPLANLMFHVRHKSLARVRMHARTRDRHRRLDVVVQHAVQKDVHGDDVNE
jgi:hypothetical protein